MTVSAPQATAIEQLELPLKKISTLNLEALEKRLNPVIRGFEPVRSQVESAIFLAERTLEINWDNIPLGLIGEVLQCVYNIQNLLAPLESFTLNLDVPAASQEQALYQAFTRVQDTQGRPPLLFYCSRLASLLPFPILLNQGAEKNAADTQELSIQADELSELIRAKTSEINSLLDAAKEATASVGVERHVKEFALVADGHRDASQAWLITTAVIAVVAAGVAAALLSFVEVPTNASNAEIVLRVSSRLIVISMIFSAALWSGKNYKAHRHLNVLNQHRQTALQTFQAFVAAAEGDVAVKNAILLECTRTIFAQNVTGYLDSEPGPTGSNFVDIIRSVSKAGDGK